MGWLEPALVLFAPRPGRPELGVDVAVRDGGDTGAFATSSVGTTRVRRFFTALLLSRGAGRPEGGLELDAVGDRGGNSGSFASSSLKRV